MKKLIAVLAAILLASLFSCASGGASASRETNAASTAQSTPAVKPYTGDGGKGISLAILAPKGSGLADIQNYLPALVQGEFVSNISGYSAISVLDRVNLDNIVTETLDPHMRII